jgi:hypothetical protein
MGTVMNITMNMINVSLSAAHEVGLASLQVACEGFVISNSVIFEYKKPAREDRAFACEPKLERSSSDNLLKFTLLQRLEAMDGRLQIKQEPDGSDLVSGLFLVCVTFMLCSFLCHVYQPHQASNLMMLQL